MLPADFGEVAEVEVDVPEDGQRRVGLVVVGGAATDEAVEFG